MSKKPIRSGPRIRITRGKKDEALDPRTDERKFVYSCQYCRLKFTQNSHLFRHMSSNHQLQQLEATYECNECQIVFNKKSNLDIHCQTQHQNKSKSKCDTCAITFKSRYCLQRHLKLKQLLAENSCVNCHKKFMSKDGLVKHVNSKHTYKNAMFQCDHCSLKFKAKTSLQTHLSRIHKKL